MPTADMSATARVRCRTTDRSAMTVSLYIASSVIIAAKKIDIRPRIPAVVIPVINVASVTAVHVTHTSRQNNRENKDQSVTKFHAATLSRFAAYVMG